MRERHQAQWRKSSRSGAGNACVEIAELTDGDRAVSTSFRDLGEQHRFGPDQCGDRDGSGGHRVGELVADLGQFAVAAADSGTGEPRVARQ